MPPGACTLASGRANAAEQCALASSAFTRAVKITRPLCVSLCECVRACMYALVRVQFFEVLLGEFGAVHRGHSREPGPPPCLLP